METENKLCSKMYKSNISIEIYLSMAEAIKTAPTIILKTVEMYLLWIFIHSENFGKNNNIKIWLN
jgi:hypothetical protein